MFSVLSEIKTYLHSPVNGHKFLNHIHCCEIVVLLSFIELYGVLKSHFLLLWYLDSFIVFLQ